MCSANLYFRTQGLLPAPKNPRGRGRAESRFVGQVRSGYYRREAIGGVSSPRERVSGQHGEDRGSGEGSTRSSLNVLITLLWGRIMADSSLLPSHAVTANPIKKKANTRSAIRLIKPLRTTAEHLTSYVGCLTRGCAAVAVVDSLGGHSRQFSRGSVQRHGHETGVVVRGGTKRLHAAGLRGQSTRVVWKRSAAGRS